MTTNINPLYSNLYKFTLGRGDSKLTLLGQKVTVPGIQLSTQGQPTTLGVQIPVATNTFTFEALRLEFMVDANLENWKSIYDWMKVIGNISNDTETTPYQDWASYATLNILQSSYCPGDRTFNSYYLIPVALSGLPFTSQASDTFNVMANVTFSYSYYSVE